jgi:hypothetical protein
MLRLMRTGNEKNLIYFHTPTLMARPQRRAYVQQHMREKGSRIRLSQSGIWASTTRYLVLRVKSFVDDVTVVRTAASDIQPPTEAARTSTTINVAPATRDESEIPVANPRRITHARRL